MKNGKVEIITNDQGQLCHCPETIRERQLGSVQVVDIVHE